MRKHVLRAPDDHIPDSALADVAFLLLIFFLATTVIAEEFGIPLALPPKGATVVEVHPANVMRLTTDATGNVVYVDGRVIAPGDLRQMFRERQARSPQLVILIDPDRRAPYRSMVDLLDEAKLGGAGRISVRTRR